MAEGGCGGNSAIPERNQKVDSPAVLLESAGHHRKKYSFHEKKQKSGVRNMKRAKSIFLWWGEQSEQRRGWLP